MMATTTVLDDDQAYDHAGQPIAPLSPTGLPYRYKLRGQGLSSYASTAEEILALVIEDYPSAPSPQTPTSCPATRKRLTTCASCTPSV